MSSHLTFINEKIYIEQIVIARIHQIKNFESNTVIINAFYKPDFRNLRQFLATTFLETLVNLYN